MTLQQALIYDYLNLHTTKNWKSWGGIDTTNGSVWLDYGRCRVVLFSDGEIAVWDTSGIPQWRRVNVEGALAYMEAV